MTYLLAYISRAKVTCTQAILDDITEKSNVNNSALEVTGVLLLNGNYFFQVLEGREDIVKDLYAKICKDTRHYEHRVIVGCNIERRFFSEWFMRCHNLNYYYDINVSAFRKRISTLIGRQVNDKNDIFEMIKSFKRLDLKVS